MGAHIVPPSTIGAHLQFRCFCRYAALRLEIFDDSRYIEFAAIPQPMHGVPATKIDHVLESRVFEEVRKTFEVLDSLIDRKDALCMTLSSFLFCLKSGAVRTLGEIPIVRTGVWI